MKKIIIILIFIITPLLLLYTVTSSYKNEKCGTDLITQIHEKKYPEYKKQRSKVNEKTEHWISKNSNKQSSIITIPVVVHVVWNTNQENISDAQIFSQIDILNQDYRRTNIDQLTHQMFGTLYADTEIEFCLANTDPNGNFTNGITRTQTSQTSFSIQNDGMKSRLKWWYRSILSR